MDEPMDGLNASLTPSGQAAGARVVRRLVRRAVEHREALAVALLLVGVGLAIARIALVAVPLGYDESVYASGTRALSTGAPMVSAIFRPPGLPVAGLLALPFGLGDASLRMVAAGWGWLALGLAWGLARLLWEGALAAGIALVATVVSPVVLNQVVLFHNDMPAAAPVLALMLLLWWQLEVRDRPSAVLLAAGPLAATAFYLRYGALVLLVGIAVAAMLLWGGRLLRQARLAGAALLVTVALFLPHVVDAVSRTGSPLGIVRAAVNQVDTTTPLQSAVQYFRWLPSQLAGVVGIVLIVAAGLAVVHAAVVSIRDRRASPAARRLVWLLVPAAVAAAGTVMVSHAEARYVLTPLMLAEIAGAGSSVAAIAWLTRRVARTRPNVTVVVGPVIAVGLVVLLVVDGRSWMRASLRHTGDPWLRDAGRAMAADAAGPCRMASSIGPILGWYSGCAPTSLVDPASALAPADAGMPVYVVLTTLDESRGTKPQVLTAYRSRLDLVEIARFGKGAHVATVYRVRP